MGWIEIFKQPLGTSRREPILASLFGFILLALTCLAYRETLGFGFLNFDDPQYVTANARVQAGFTLDNLKWAFTTGYFSNWHPLVWLSYMLDVELFGLNARAFHAVNLGLHLANTVLLFLLLSKATGQTVASFLVAALFGVHPLHCESVTWIAERKDVLSTFWGLLALAAYHHYSRLPCRARYLTVTLFLAAGLMTKPMLVTWPFVFLLWDYWPAGRLQYPFSRDATRSLLLEKIPWVGLAGIASLISLLVQNRTSFDVALYARLTNALVSYFTYIDKLLAPFNLAIFYPHPGNTLGIPEVVPAVIVLVGVTAISVLTFRTRPYFVFGWLWYVGTLVPVIGLVQIGYQGMADRYTYIPSIGVFVLVVWVSKDLVTGIRTARLVAVGLVFLVVLPAMTWSTIRQNRHWRNSTTLFEHAIRVTENNFFAHNNLGATLAREGDLQKAELHFRRALQLQPDYSDALYNLGQLLQMEGKTAESFGYLRRAADGTPSNPDYQYACAQALLASGRGDDAFRYYARALEADPSHRASLFARAAYYIGQNQIGKAAVDYERALDLDPKDVDALVNLGSALALLGRYEEGDRLLDTALKLDPRNVRAHQNRGRLFEDQGQVDKAAASYKEAIRLAPGSPHLSEALKRVQAK